VYGCNGRGVKEFSHPLKQLRGHTNVVYRAACTEPHDENRGFWDPAESEGRVHVFKYGRARVDRDRRYTCAAITRG